MLSGRSERMRASGPLQREVRRLFLLPDVSETFSLPETSYRCQHTVQELSVCTGRRERGTSAGRC